MLVSRRVDELARSLPFCLASQLRNKKNKTKNQQKNQLGFLKRVPLLQEPLPGFSQKCVSELGGWD